MLLLLSAIALAAPVPADSILNNTDRSWQLQPVAEIGFLAPLSHIYQSGNGGSEFDYITEGGQDNLFLVTRWSLDLQLKERNTVTFLYQPLNIRTAQVAQRDLAFDEVVFTDGTPIELRYGFDFYRASYTRDVLADPDKELGFGASLQIRNAAIEFVSTDGTQRSTTRDIGPVPVLKVKGRFDSDAGSWWGFEADGFYAPIKYLNGGTTDVVGAIADISLRGGLSLNNGLDPFLNLRYLGGGAEGTTDNPEPGTDGFTRNWLHFTTLTIGFMVR